MIDLDGYRPNVGIIIVNKEGKLFWGKRIQQDSWQFPQGGIGKNETPQQAVFRELKEEVGLDPSDVRILGRTRDWISYDIPKRLIRYYSKPICIGQKQIWFMLGLEGEDDRIKLDLYNTPEFEDWKWVDYWLPVQEVVNFKQSVYHQALTQLEGTLEGFWLNTHRT